MTMTRNPASRNEIPGVVIVKTQTITYFSDHEEQFCQLLTRLGIRRNVARSLVFLASVPETTSREIERSTDLRQPEVSLAMQHLIKRAWVTAREFRPENRGRPAKVYSLAVPMENILSVIEEEKRNEVNRTIQLAQQLRDYVGNTIPAA
jgi:predicted transcriptional regulator